MHRLTVKQYLEIYRNRKKIQEYGIIFPSDEIIAAVDEIIKSFSKLPPEEKISISDGKFLDSQGNLIAKLPPRPGE